MSKRLAPEKKCYSVDFRIKIFTLEAVNEQHAMAIIHKWVDNIAPVMADKVQWDDVDWDIWLDDEDVA